MITQATVLSGDLLERYLSSATHDYGIWRFMYESENKMNAKRVASVSRYKKKSGTWRIGARLLWITHDGKLRYKNDPANN